jgi:hypothetical protein
MAKFMDHEVGINLTGVSFERLDGEVVIISFETGKYFNSNGPAADLLHLIENGVPQSEWEEILSNSFADFQLNTGEIVAFLMQIVEEKIAITGAAPSMKISELPCDYARSQWSAPQLRIFDDLADLLLIDPIHDTSVEGWPAARND